MEFVSRTAIFELASEMKSAKDDVKNVRNILLEHLIKIIIFPKSTSLQHWKDEVFDYLRIINKIKLKPKNRRLSSELLIDLIIGEPLGSGPKNKPDTSTTEEWIKEMRKLYKGENAINITSDEVTNLLNNFIVDFCKKTSKGFMDIDDITDLVNKFPTK